MKMYPRMDPMKKPTTTNTAIFLGPTRFRVWKTPMIASRKASNPLVEVCWDARLATHPQGLVVSMAELILFKIVEIYSSVTRRRSSHSTETNSW